MVESILTMPNVRGFRLARLGVLRTHFPLIVLAASVFLFVAGLKPFQIGLWFQSEPVTLWLFAFASVVAAIFVFSARAHDAFIAATQQPVVRLLLAMVLWSLFCALFATFPMRALLGTPEIGEGVFSLLALLLLTIGAFYVWQNPRHRFPLVASAAIACVMAATLQTVSSTTDWRPVQWPDFAAFIAIFVMIILLAYPESLARKHFVAAGIVGLFGVLASHNIAAMMILASLVPLAIGLLWLRRRLQDERRFRHRARQIFIGMALSPILITLATLNISAMRSISRHLGETLHITNLNSQSFEQGSLGTRVLFNHVVLDAIIDKPSLLLVGDGSGSFADVSFDYVFTDGIRLYNDKALWDPNWNLVMGNTFHSHNSFLEALISNGLIGLALYCLLPVLIIRRLPAEKLLVLGPLWASLFLLSMFWFMLPLMLPFMAIALAASMRPSADAAAPASRTLSRRVTQAMCAIVVGTLSIGAWVQYSTASSADALLAAIGSRTPQPADRDTLRDHHRGNHHLWWLAVSMGEYMHNKIANKQAFVEADTAWFNEMLNMMGKVVDAGQAGDRLRGHYVFMHNDLIALYNAPQWSKLRLQRLAQWKKVVLDGVHAVPTRSDMALVYGLFFIERMTPKEKPEVREAMAKELFAVTEDILHNNPDDPVALWFSGLALLNHSDTESLGFKRLIRALDLGADRVVPVAESARKAIDAQRKN